MAEWFRQARKGFEGSNPSPSARQQLIYKLFITTVMEIQKKNIIAAYEGADEKGKEMLKALFPDVTFNEKDDRPITERIKTFQDAYDELSRRAEAGDKSASLLVDDWDCLETESEDIIAFVKLRIVCAALNEGWEPKFTEDEVRWYPWHLLYTQQIIDNMRKEERKKLAMMSTDDYVTEYAGFACAYSNNSPSNATAIIGSRLCLKDGELAAYCGTQFIELWAGFKLLSK